MALFKWIGLGALALTLWVTPAQAAKELVVDWRNATIYPLENGRLVREPIVTNNGRWFKRRYLGTFRISEKIVEKRSNMYNTRGNPIRPGQLGARMPFWMRIGNTSQGFHYSTAFSPTGPRQRSNGCYRLSKTDAIWMFRWTPVGTRVHVVSSVCGSRFAYVAGSRCRAAAKPKATRSVSRR